MNRSFIERIGHMPGFLALKRSTVLLLIVVVLVEMGERFLPIFMIALGGGALSIGLLNAMYNLLSAL